MYSKQKQNDMKTENSFVDYKGINDLVAANTKAQNENRNPSDTYETRFHFQFDCNNITHRCPKASRNLKRKKL